MVVGNLQRNTPERYEEALATARNLIQVHRL
jgi:hypothetical protein